MTIICGSILRRFIILVILMSVLVGSMAAGLPPIIRRKVFFGNPEHANPLISPDGTKIAYLAPSRGILNIWFRDIGVSNDSVVTNDTIKGIETYFWAEDNSHIIYRQDRAGDENWHFFSIEIHSKSIKDITPYEGIQARLIGTDHKFPNKLLAALNLRNKKLHDAYLVDIESGEKSLLAENPGNVVEWLADSNFVVRAALAQASDGGYLLQSRENNKSPWRTVATWSPEDGIPSIDGFTSDNEHLYVEDARKFNTSRLVELFLKDGTTRVLASDPDYDISKVLIDPSDRHLEAVSFYKEREEWTFLDSTLTGIFKYQEKYRGDIYIHSRSNSNSRSVIRLVKDILPDQYFIYDRDANTLTYLFSERSSLEKYKLANVSPITVTAKDGLTLHAYLTFPQGIDPDSLPIVVLVHEESWSRDRWGLNPEAQWLANRGYGCLQVNFRGSTGYGKKFLNAGNREWGAKILSDINDVIDWLAEEGVVNPNRVAIFGQAFGGYTAIAAAAYYPNRFVCAIDVAGPSNLAAFLKSLPPYYGPMNKMLFNRIGDPVKDAKLLKKRSPFFSADRITTPLLITHGKNDQIVKIAESEQLVKALKLKNKNVQYLPFPDEGRCFAKPENRLKFYEAAEQFLGKYLGGRIED
jgi:dipeptidyl aminopeptidase/acylaminoacyl peptidase